MNAVVDTNVVAYLLLGTMPFADEARNFWARVDTVRAPASWEAEITNVLWLAARQQVISAEGALVRLRAARDLGVVSVSVRSLWEGALTRATSAGLPAYDTLFVELAQREGVRLATFDSALLAQFPAIAIRPGALVA